MVNQSPERPPHNLGLDLVRATEAAALAAGRWVGLGKPIEADTSATEQMHATLNLVDIEATVSVGEEARVHSCDALRSGQCVGTGKGPTLDLVVDAIDGRNLVAEGHPGAIAVMAVAPRGALWRPSGASYMEKIVVDAEVADAFVPECLDAPAAWTLGMVARAKEKDVEDLTVFVLNRPRHEALISEIREAGAHVMLRDEGDVTGALLAGRPGTHVDVLMGVGGITEGIIAACALRATEGAMIGRLRPQSDKEQAKVVAAGFDLDRILVTEEIVNTDQVFFAATGITDGPILRGVRYSGERAQSHSLVMRGTTRTRRMIHTQHLLTEQAAAWRRYIPGKPFR
ncbi:MAG: class II fructose-bisphosphatase [Chloroflexota bacterium]